VGFPVEQVFLGIVRSLYSV